MTKAKNSHDDFILQTRTAPDDAILEEYANWLDAQPDDRAEFLRAFQAVRSADQSSIESADIYRQFHELRKNTDATWIEQMDLWRLNALPMDYSADSIQEEALDTFESDLEIAPLPLRYREFLLTSNGGVSREYSQFPEVGEVGRFLSVNCGDWDSDLLEQSEHLWDVLQNTDVGIHRPIPISSFGLKAICLHAAGPDRGKIYLYDEVEEETRQPVAESFTHFIVGLERCTRERAGYEPTPLFESIQLGDRKGFQRLFNKEFIEVIGGLRDETPLLCALRYSKLDIVRFLLSEGANPNAQCGSECAMDLAAQRNQPLVKLLLKHGADPNGVDRSNSSPLFWAIMNGREAIAKLLVERGASVETRDSEYPTIASACDDGGFLEDELNEILQRRS
ncbi:MAG: ankyrin repeat domain-containing protein [Planctomycetales bacterium]